MERGKWRRNKMVVGEEIFEMDFRILLIKRRLGRWLLFRFCMDIS
jgi:hypothetical protein